MIEELSLTHSRTTAASLTESRIRKILDLHDHLRQKTRKDAQKFLQIPRLPDLGQGETLEEVVGPQMARYFAGSNEDPVQGNPAAAEEMLRQATGYAEKQVRQLETISDAEVLAVSNCMQEIEGRLLGRLKKIRR